MLSGSYSAKILPEVRSRRRVLGTGLAFGLCATVLIVQMPLQPQWRAGAGVAWGIMSMAELWLAISCLRKARSYRLYPDGTVSIRYTSLAAGTGQLMPGSVVLQRCAWLRFCTPSGASWGEPVTRAGQNPEQWRRLQVICRHRTAC